MQQTFIIVHFYVNDKRGVSRSNSCAKKLNCFILDTVYASFYDPCTPSWVCQVSNFT